MIHFRLSCNAGHEFEGWFPSGEAYDRQAKRKQITCATCGSTKIAKVPMAPAIAGKGAMEQAKAQEMRQLLDMMRAKVEKNCDYVGPAFAEEARKIHYGESDKRGIYGETSDDEARALAEEGIDFARLPWPRRTDS
ncbi:MAG: DUF1178 family protein [Alphaproteobacteria bacterium]|nr:DUF1178 family protein [Alphaproteobacteria bacterium]